MSSNDITDVLLSRLSEIQQDTKQLNNSLSRIEARLCVMEAKQETVEKAYSTISNKVEALSEKKNKASGIISLILFAIPTGIALLSFFQK